MPTSQLVLWKHMPKLESPFVREECQVPVIKKGVPLVVKGKPITKKRFLVTPKMDPEYRWVFEDGDIKVVEKLDGTCVSIVIRGGELIQVINKTDPIAVHLLSRNRCLEGLRYAFSKDRMPMEDGQYFGELMGPGVQKNFLGLEDYRWFPFAQLIEKFSYKEWPIGDTYKDGTIPLSNEVEQCRFQAISDWMKVLESKAWKSYHGGDGEVPFAEGIVFHHPDGRMAKLRRDMFDWYKGKGHKETATTKV